MTSRPVPRLNLAESLGLHTERDAGHRVKQVDPGEDISWGTPPPTTQRNATRQNTPKPVVQAVAEPATPQPTPNVATQPKLITTKPKYSYLDSGNRPDHELTGRMPPDPLRQKIDEAQQMGAFFEEFKDFMLADQFDRIEAERKEETKRRGEVVEQMLADVMSRGACSATDQSVAQIDRHTGPMKNQCRRLHDTKINHSGSTTQKQMSQRTLFKGRFITKSDKDALRQLYGFFFGDGKLALYEYRSFGKTNYNRNVTPILDRQVYCYQHGARKGEQYVERDIRYSIAKHLIIILIILKTRYKPDISTDERSFSNEVNAPWFCRRSNHRGGGI